MLKKMMHVLVLSVFCLVSTQGQAELVSEWKFDGNAKDSVGNNHGTLKGNPAWAVDRFGDEGKALSLNGVSVACGNDASLSFGNGTKDRPFSIETWVNMNNRTNFIIVDKTKEYILTNNNNIRLYLYDSDKNNHISKNAGDLTKYEGKWTHLVVTYDGSSIVEGIKFYINGILVKSNGGTKGNYIAMKNRGGSFGWQERDGLIDDFKIYNHVLSPAEVEACYKLGQPVSREKIEDLESSLIRLEKRVHSLPVSHSLRKVVNYQLSLFRRNIQSIRDKNFMISSIEAGKNKEIDLSVKQFNLRLTLIEEGRINNRDYLPYVVSPISKVKILPYSILGEISDEVSIIACAGEYEPGSFVITALSDIDSLRIKATDLIRKKTGHSRKQEIIPASAIDIKIVKCWYQAGTAWVANDQDKSKRILIPELLLNDDTLVKVDYEKKGNYLKLSFPEGEKYVWISDPADVNQKSFPIEDFPVKDSAVLLPVDIPAGRNQQFWITVKVPEDSKPGIYTGKINLLTQKRPLGALTLKLKVLPFKLAAPYYTFSIDYHGSFDPENPEKGTISSGRKTRRQFKKELENMVAHGLSNCQHYGIKKKILGKVLAVRKEAGMDNKILYLKGTIVGRGGRYIGIGNPTSPEKLERLKRDVRDIIEFVKPYGTEVVYFYGMDEVTDKKLMKSQRPAWKAVREAGGRIFTAGCGLNISMMGDIQDMHVSAGGPSKEKAEAWHSYGHKIFSYCNPQIGVENPVVYRRNFGLLLWKCNYDGAADNAYQHTFGATWNDFDNPKWRSHTAAYPTIDGVIDTIAWEGYREAADDVRYVTTLQKAIKKAMKSNNQKLKPIAASAEDYLRRLKTGAEIEKGDLDTIRMEIIGYILKLQD